MGICVIVYGLSASGPLKHLDGQKQYLHHRVFVDKNKAEDAIPAFLNSCCNSDPDDPRSLTDLDVDKAKVVVIELDLIE